MMIRDSLARQGRTLFRWRSYFPLVLLPLLLVALYHTGTIGRLFGEEIEEGWDGLCLLVGLSGLALRCATVGFVPAGTSGRNTHEQRAEVLNTTGLYSLLRHPLYVANFVMFFGMTMMVQVWWFTAIAVLIYWLYYERIAMAEEAFLETKFGQPYRDWAERTPAFVPRLRGWKRPALGFSWRTVLRREHNGLFLIVAIYSVIELVSDAILEGHWELETNWVILLLATGLTFLVINQIKKRTRLLHTPGR